MIGLIAFLFVILPLNLIARDFPLPFSNSSSPFLGQTSFDNPANSVLGESKEINLNLAEWKNSNGEIQRFWSLSNQGQGHAEGLRLERNVQGYEAQFDLSLAENWGSLFSPGIRLSYIASEYRKNHGRMDAGLLVRPWNQLLLGYWASNAWTGGGEKIQHQGILAIRPLATKSGMESDFQIGGKFAKTKSSGWNPAFFTQIPLYPGLRLISDWELNEKKGAVGLVFQLNGPWSAGLGMNPLALGKGYQAGIAMRQDHRFPHLGPAHKVFELDLNRKIIEGITPESWFGSNSDLGLLDLLAQFDVLDSSPEIDGIILNLGRTHCGWAMAEEIRRRIVKLRKEGRHLVAYLDQVNPISYFLASAANKIAVQPQGYFAVIGLSAEVTFYRGFFDKIGVEPQFLRHGKFKSFEEPYTRTKFSEPAKADLGEYLGSLWAHYIEVVSASRNLSQDSLRLLLESGEISLIRAQKSGLIDTLVQADQVLKLAGGPKASLTLNLSKKLYRENWNIPPKIVVVTVTGEMVSGQSSVGWLAGRELAGSETVARQLRIARHTPGVKAVVLRVDSPGGSAQAADIMTREIELLKEAHIPVIASVGHSAASGGYYLICGADKIFAEPNSTVGSIGVLWGKFVLKGLYEKLGLNVEAVKTSVHADGNSMNRVWDSTEVKILQKYMDDFYREFVHKVAVGRSKSDSAIDSLGQGRIFTGKQALLHGLVDQLGGLEDAILSAKKLAGIKAESAVDLEIVPPESGPQGFTGLGRGWSMFQVGLPNLETEWSRVKMLTQPGLWAICPELLGGMD